MILDPQDDPDPAEIIGVVLRLIGCVIVAGVIFYGVTVLASWMRQ